MLQPAIPATHIAHKSRGVHLRAKNIGYGGL
jgi:hypothetical protein